MTVRGRILDTLGQEPIASATVSIYQKDNGKLLKYGFTNNRGAFTLTEVALADSVFRLQVSHIGYGTVERDIGRSLTQTDIQLGDIPMHSVSNLIEEVHVRPPVMMDRDTLIINPEAFDVAPNAVVEDLLTRVPGIVIWGDGLITVNGKKVDRVLVEGQPFFGSNAAVATRNLPADAIDKIKVYDSPRNIPDRENVPGREESLEMDIILKSDKKRGIFGKVGLGQGTNGHKERTLLVNVFDPKNQISLFAGSNNTNKVSRNASDFLAANVYKPGGEDIQSNTPRANQRGLNDFLVAGTKFQRRWNDRLRTNLELLHDDTKSDVLQGIHEVRVLGGDQEQEVVEDREDSRRNIRQSYLGTAHYTGSKWDLRINSSMQQLKTSLDQSHSRQVTDHMGQSLSDLYKGLHNEGKSRTGKVGFRLSQSHRMNPMSMQGRRPVRFGMSYDFEADNHELNQQENILFMDDDPIDRLKQNNQRGSRHHLNTELGLNELLRAIGVRRMGGVALGLDNTLRTHQSDEDQQDFLFDPATDGYTIRNEAITYSDRWREIMWTPTITASKGFVKQMGRGQNHWTYSTGLGLETTSRKNASDHELRVFDQQMLYLLPSAGIRYNRTRQLSNKTVSLDYKSLVHQPRIEQLIALIDTTQRDFNRVGNRDLKPQEEYQFQLAFSDIHHAKNRNQTLRFTYSLYRNQHVNSNIYSSTGERLSQTVNAAGLPSFRADYQYRRARQVWGRPLNISLFSQLNGGQRYFFNNDERQKNSRVMMNHRPEIQYTLSDNFKMGLLGSYNMAWNSSGLNNTRTSSMSAGLDAVLTWPRRTTWISRFMSVTNRFSSGGIPADQRYLWNVDVYYRMLEKEQLEIKLSAFDILNNNRAVINTLTDNVVRQVRINNIQQFFMIGLSYYPRFF